MKKISMVVMAFILLGGIGFQAAARNACGRCSGLGISSYRQQTGVSFLDASSIPMRKNNFLFSAGTEYSRIYHGIRHHLEAAR